MEQCISTPVSFVNCKTKLKSFALKLGCFFAQRRRWGLFQWVVILVCSRWTGAACLCEYGPPPWNPPLQRAWCCAHRATAGSPVSMYCYMHLLWRGEQCAQCDRDFTLLCRMCFILKGRQSATATTCGQHSSRGQRCGSRTTGKTRQLSLSKWNASHTFQSFFSKFYWQYNRSWRIKHFSPWHFFPPSLK